MIHAHVVCAALAGGGLDCAVVVDRDRAAVWQRVIDGRVTIASARPFDPTPPATRELGPEGPDGHRYVADRAFDAGDFLRCADTIVRGELDGTDGAIWRGTIHVRAVCAPPPRLHPRAHCSRAMITMQPPPYDGYNPDPVADRVVIACSLSYPSPPPDGVRAFARLGTATSDDDRNLDFPDPPGDHCVRARVELAVTTADGALVWRGATRVDCDGVEVIIEPG